MLIAVIAALFLAAAFGVGYSSGASTVNNRLDCRQARDDQAIGLFTKLITSDGHGLDPGVVNQLRRVSTGPC